ncbi:hypothetical protein E4U43_006846 [Claviceps pusilla]|uniref:Yeast cell wall synthesis Kre9/Knh1-like N-terminal domain-containing protein n=1 Tax=Claviceps pusilla TaxID=123648 RepID=A0A9P7T016_9HYPO|nr:hypothetical protein E4U43_006846 [Claviceps pusilla]
MKYAAIFSALAAIAAAAAAAAANPSFLNSDFDVKEGASFTLKFNNCQGGCTIILQNGPSTNTQDVKTLTTSAAGDSFTFVAKDIATGTYNFKIISNTDASAFNYSKQFAYSGTGAIGLSSSSTRSVGSTLSPSSSSHTASSTVSATASSIPSSTPSTTMASVTSSSSGFTKSFPSSTSAEQSSSTQSSAPAITTVPNAGGRASSSLALVAGAVAALAYLG